MCYDQRAICTKAAAVAETETEMKHTQQIAEERIIEMNTLHTREEDRGIHMIMMIAALHIHDHTTMAAIMKGTKRGGEENHRHHIIRHDDIEKVGNMIQSIIVIIIITATVAGGDTLKVMNQSHHHTCHRTP